MQQSVFLGTCGITRGPTRNESRLLGDPDKTLKHLWTARTSDEAFKRLSGYLPNSECVAEPKSLPSYENSETRNQIQVLGRNWVQRAQ